MLQMKHKQELYELYLHQALVWEGIERVSVRQKYDTSKIITL